jgi:hypothetical protein
VPRTGIYQHAHNFCRCYGEKNTIGIDGLRAGAATQREDGNSKRGFSHHGQMKDAETPAVLAKEIQLLQIPGAGQE